jgi:hypothetical protein
MFGATASRSQIGSSPCAADRLTPTTPQQVTRRDEDYYLIQGYSNPVPVKRAPPSQDGEYWIFYREDPNGQSGVYCFFVPWHSDIAIWTLVT